MSSFIWPGNGGTSAVPTFTNLAAFPSAAGQGAGSLAVALDSYFLYESNGSAWLLVGAPSYWLPLAGGTMTGNIAMGGNKVTGLGAPSGNGDALRYDQLGANSGIATLDSGGKIPLGQLPASLMEYQGTWNATTNSPTLADGTGTSGFFYRVNTGGTQNLGSGSQTFVVGDWVMYNGSIWQLAHAGADAVISVNGAAGVVTVNAINQLTGDVTASAAAGSQSKATALVATTNATLTTLSALTSIGTIGTGVWQGTKIVEAYGGTNQSTYTLGDLLYASAANTLSKLAGNTTSTNKFLAQTGTGTVSAAPGWVTLVAGDIPSLAASKITSGTLAVAQGGTNLASGTSGGILGYTATGTLASSALLAAGGVVYGGGAGVTPAATAAGTTSQVLIGGTTPSFGNVPTAAIPASTASGTIGGYTPGGQAGYTGGSAISAGNIGEMITAAGSNVSMSSASQTTICTATVTAGVWLVSAQLYGDNSGTQTGFDCYLYTKGANSATLGDDKLGFRGVAPPGGTVTFSPRVVNVASGDTKTMILKAQSSTATGAGYGAVYCTRIA